MSKAALRKELGELNTEQLRDLIADIYDSSKEAKAYLEFFINPDAEALLEKKIDAIAKEAARSKRGHSKARSTVIRKHIAELIAYKIGSDYVLRLTHEALLILVEMERRFRFTSAQENCIKRLVADYITLSVDEDKGEETLAIIKALAADRSRCTRYMGNRIIAWADDTLRSTERSFLV